MTAIAIFVKTPGLSPVKTRLAVDWGRERAESWHRRAALAVAGVSSQADVGPVYWAIAEPEAMDAPLWSELPVLAQGPGGLGERMACVHSELVRRHGSGILLGADAPQLTAALLRQASGWLQQNDARLVAGPANDGGFWLFGANRIIPRERWLAAPYSQADTLTTFQTSLNGSGRWLMLDELCDLDQTSDLIEVENQLAQLSDPHPRQQKLLVWLRQQQPSKPPSPDS